MYVCEAIRHVDHRRGSLSPTGRYQRINIARSQGTRLVALRETKGSDTFLWTKLDTLVQRSTYSRSDQVLVASWWELC